MDLNAAANAVSGFNAPFSNTRSVAKADGELLLLLRGVPEANAARTGRRGRNVNRRRDRLKRGKKPGTIGYGHIGTQLGILAESPDACLFLCDIENNQCRAW